MVNEPPSPEGKTTRFVSQHLPRTCNFFQGNKSSLQNYGILYNTTCWFSETVM